jgi:hypothetical protein
MSEDKGSTEHKAESTSAERRPKRLYDNSLAFVGYSLVLFLLAFYVAGDVYFEQFRVLSSLKLLYPNLDPESAGSSDALQLGVYTTAFSVIGAALFNIFQVVSDAVESRRPRTYYGGPLLAFVTGIVTYIVVRGGVFIYEGEFMPSGTGDSTPPILSYIITGLVVGFGPREAVGRLRDRITSR